MKIQLNSTSERKLQLHYWYVDILKKDGRKRLVAHGIVTGHNGIEDSVFIHTSEVKQIIADYSQHEILIETQNSLYHCPLIYCDFAKQDKNAKIIPDYKYVRDKYKNKLEAPMIGPENILLVLANFNEFYFNDFVCVTKENVVEKYFAAPHIGMIQDSFLIRTREGDIDVRYFPHPGNIEFYCVNTCEMPLYVENIGDIVLYIEYKGKQIKLQPGERKEVCEENAENEEVLLSKGNMYPPMMMEW